MVRIALNATNRVEGGEFSVKKEEKKFLVNGCTNEMNLNDFGSIFDILYYCNYTGRIPSTKVVMDHRNIGKKIFLLLRERERELQK